jgi:hypothetical protein
MKNQGFHYTIENFILRLCNGNSNMGPLSGDSI